MARPQATLTPEFQSNDPYCWLAGDSSYRMPAEALKAIPVPEIHSMEMLASFKEAGNTRSGDHILPIFFDPSYGLLTLAERELIGVIVSEINSCVTCVIIHTHKLGELIGDHGRARRIAINYRTVTLSAEERAIADYCVKLTEQPGRLEASDLQKLRDAGICDAKIYFVVEIASVFNLTNRMTAGYGLRPDDEFMAQIAPAHQHPERMASPAKSHT